MFKNKTLEGAIFKNNLHLKIRYDTIRYDRRV